ncbi:transporter [Xenorhabdus sp. DI]|uniref:SphA family protein n=1 Tax=Xenorhabdus doucetiae TaxID=351671 RepID=UPI0019AEE1D0|nr:MULTISPECIES: transporter [unclassified Xenorhabdus]MBD2783280.1 transporter [Xenorhabdus sp. 3]MBD2788035.1 transporter [Xenorhabdus sp. DI]
MTLKFRQFIYAAVLSLPGFLAMLSAPAMATEGGVGAYPDGLDNYLSGALPPAGVHALFYGGHIHYNKLKGDNGDVIPVPGFKVNVNVLAPRLVWVTETSVFGGQLAYHAIVPLLDVTANAAGKHNNSKGIGDITIGPALGYHPAPDLAYVVGLNVNAPTGHYDRKDPSSLGKNYWTAQPVWALSYFPAYGINADLKVMYDVNFRNGATQTKSGQALHTDYALGWGFGNGLVVGVGGYLFQQITHDRGANAASGKASAVGFGPSVRYANDKGWLVTLKWQKDVAVSNRPSGSQIFLKAAIPF